MKIPPNRRYRIIYKHKGAKAGHISAPMNHGDAVQFIADKGAGVIRTILKHSDGQKITKVEKDILMKAAKSLSDSN